MASFRFRAQAALDLRRRQHDDAQRLLAKVTAERQEARARLDEALQVLAAARRDADAAAAVRGSAVDPQWYRFWILRLDQQRAVLAAVLEMRDVALGEASAACLRARVKREALERFREKAQLAHGVAEATAERKVIDELATRRFTARRESTEGAEL